MALARYVAAVRQSIQFLCFRAKLQKRSSGPVVRICWEKSSDYTARCVTKLQQLQGRCPDLESVLQSQVPVDPVLQSQVPWMRACTRVMSTTIITCEKTV